MSRRVIGGGLALAVSLLALWACPPGLLQAEYPKKNEPKKKEEGGKENKRPACAGDTPKQSDTKTGFVRLTYNDGETDYKYAAFIPHDYDPDGDKKYPVILFLHGRNLEGSDGWKPTTVGLGPAIVDNEDDFDFIVVFPQAVTPWGEDGTVDLDRARAILGDFLTNSDYKDACDLERVSVSGLSQGGHATWCLAAAGAPEVDGLQGWAAAVVVAGFSDCKGEDEDLAEDADKIKDIPTWFFHGKDDQHVSYDCGQKLARALTNARGTPRFTTDDGKDYPLDDPRWAKTGTHNGCWFKDVYTGKVAHDHGIDGEEGPQDLWDWWRKQKRE